MHAVLAGRPALLGRLGRTSQFPRRQRVSAHPKGVTTPLEFRCAPRCLLRTQADSPPRWTTNMPLLDTKCSMNPEHARFVHKNPETNNKTCHNAYIYNIEYTEYRPFQPARKERSVLLRGTGAQLGCSVCCNATQAFQQPFQCAGILADANVICKSKSIFNAIFQYCPGKSRLIRAYQSTMAPHGRMRRQTPQERTQCQGSASPTSQCCKGI